MFRLSGGLFVLVLLLVILTYSSFWPLNFVRFSKLPVRDYVLGAATAKNIDVRTTRLGDYEKVTISALVFRGQKTVYHRFSTLKNPDSQKKSFLIVNPRVVSGDDSVRSYGVFFSKGGNTVRELELLYQEEAEINLEVSANDTGPDSFLVELEFLLISLT